jgi:DNA gyrase/topoisomerase IV subunit A
LVTDAGKVIRIRVDGGEGDTIRVAGRKTQGVRLFEVDGTERVVSVGVIRDADTDDEEEELGSELGSDLDAELDAELGAGDAVADTNAMQASAEGAETTDGIDTDGADATSPNTDEAP